MGCKQSMTGRSVSLEMEAPKPKAAKVTVLSPWGGGPGCAFHYLALPPSPNFFLSFPSLPVLSPLLIVHFYFIAYSSTTMSKDESKSKDETVSVNVDEFTKTRDSVSSFFFFAHYCFCRVSGSFRRVPVNSMPYSPTYYSYCSEYFCLFL